MCPKNGGQYSFSYFRKRYGVFVEYTRSIRGVFIGYTYVSVMCRLCIGYVSGTRRSIQAAKGWRKRRGSEGGEMAKEEGWRRRRGGEGEG